jgi:hypothetical protein
MDEVAAPFTIDGRPIAYAGRMDVKIHWATYGRDDEGIDVTPRLRSLVRDGRLSLTVSPKLFGDPVPGKTKTLRFEYELPGDNRRYIHEVDDQRIVMIPNTRTKNIGIFYTSQIVDQKYFRRVIKQLELAPSIDIITCSWQPIEDNPFPELSWPFHTRSHLNLVLQILKLLHHARELGPYEYVFFLEDDVLYPESYFDLEPFAEDAVLNTNYIGLFERGFQKATAHRQQPLQQVVMKLPAAIEHFTSRLAQALTVGVVEVEPYERPWATRRSLHPAVHINHGRNFTSHFNIYSKEEVEPWHPYWGHAADWWA